MAARIKSFSVLLLLAVQAGCATAPREQIGSGVERISYETQPPPFCGRCDSTIIMASANGRLVIETGHWAGRYRDWRRQRSVRQITPAQFEDFKRRLEPYRPAKGDVQGDTGCTHFITDNDGVLVKWSGAGEPRIYLFDFGCLDEKVRNQIVRTAPAALGVAG